MYKEITPPSNITIALMKVLYWTLILSIPVYFIVGYQLFNIIVISRFFGETLPLPVYLTGFGLVAAFGINRILALIVYTHSYFKTLSEVSDFKRYHDLVKSYEPLNRYRMAIEFNNREVTVRDLKKFESYVRKHEKKSILCK
jgi:hypothetical protein